MMKYFGISFPKNVDLSEKDKHNLAKQFFISDNVSVNRVRAIIKDPKIIGSYKKLNTLFGMELVSVSNHINSEQTNAKVNLMKKFDEWVEIFDFPTLEEMQNLLDEKLINLHGDWYNIFRKVANKKFTKPNDYAQYLRLFILGQDKAIERISIMLHDQHLKINNDIPFPKTAILLIGNTGTGKTYTITKAGETIGVPIRKINCAHLVPNGIVGDSISSNLRSLYYSLDEDLKACGNAMLHFDEFDKLSLNFPGIHDFKLTIQTELLRLFDYNEKINLEGGSFFFVEEEVNLPVKNLLLFFSGAFSGLDKIIQKRIGTSGYDTSNLLQYCTTQDLIEYGFIPELAARLTYVCPLKPFSETDILNIFRNSKESILYQHLNKCDLYGLNVVFTNSALEKIAKIVYDSNIGLRYADNIFNTILSKFYYSPYKYQNKKVIITPEHIDYLLIRNNPIVLEFKMQNNLNKIAKKFNTNIDEILDLFSKWNKLKIYDEIL